MQTCILVPVSLKCPYLHTPNILWVFFFFSLSFVLHSNFKCHWNKISAWLMRLNCFISNYPCQEIAINQFLKSSIVSFRTMRHHFVCSLQGFPSCLLCTQLRIGFLQVDLVPKIFFSQTLKYFKSLPPLSSILLYLFPPTLAQKPNTHRKLKAKELFLGETTSGIRYPLGALEPANSSLLSLPVNPTCQQTNFLESSSKYSNRGLQWWPNPIYLRGQRRPCTNPSARLSRCARSLPVAINIHWPSNAFKI